MLLGGNTMENNFKKENKMSSYRNKSILLCIITFLIGFMFLDFGKRDNSKEVENMEIFFRERRSTSI